MNQDNTMPANQLVPMVVSRDGNGERAMDIYSMLLQNRIIDLSAGVSAGSCSIIRNSLLYLEKVNKNKDIHLYIDSPGGAVMSGMAVVDTMRTITPKVNVVCTGVAASMGSVILAGATGKRMMLEHSQVMLHQVSSGSQGQVADMLINAIHAKNLDIDIMRFFARVTGRSRAELQKAMDRDTWFTAEEAIAFNLADEIVDLKHSYPFEPDMSEFPYFDINQFRQ